MNNYNYINANLITYSRYDVQWWKLGKLWGISWSNQSAI